MLYAFEFAFCVARSNKILVTVCIQEIILFISIGPLPALRYISNWFLAEALGSIIQILVKRFSDSEYHLLVNMALDKA